MAHRPAVVAQACDERAQHDRHIWPHGLSIYLGGQLSDACAGRLSRRVIVCARAAHIVLKHLHGRDMEYATLSSSSLPKLLQAVSV